MHVCMHVRLMCGHLTNKLVVPMLTEYYRPGLGESHKLPEVVARLTRVKPVLA